MGLVCISSGFAADLTVNKATHPVSTDQAIPKVSAVEKDTKKALRFLFVLYAENAKMIRLKNDKYSMEMQHTNINHVIKFSDRPYRIVQYITGNESEKIMGRR